MSKSRTYELKRRAERQKETRRRIVAAAVELHTTVGPAQTTVSAIAERAGVTRPTVYAHFPNERSLFGACTTLWDERYPFPDPARWFEHDDPEAQLEAALADVYRWYGSVENDLALFARDAELVAPVREYLEEFATYRRALRDVLAERWSCPPKRRARLVAAVGHALDFRTWQSLVRDEGCDEAEGVRLMLALVRAAEIG